MLNRNGVLTGNRRCREKPLKQVFLLYGGSHIVVHLTLLFNSMLRHCVVPSDFCQGMVLPLWKCKHGDATDINMYRGITISPVISKVFELILLQVYESLFTSHPLQHGF